MAHFFTLVFVFVGSMFAHFVGEAALNGSPPPFPTTLEAGMTAVLIVGICIFCGEVIFKSSFLGALFGLVVAVLTHPLFDFFQWKATGHPLGQAGTDLFGTLVDRMGPAPMALLFICKRHAQLL
jgi:hypothetical protein